MEDAYNAVPHQCHHCGMWHQGACPRVKALEYGPLGAVERVEYHEPAPAGAEPKDWYSFQQYVVNALRNISAALVSQKRQLDLIVTLLQKESEIMATEFDALTAQVAAAVTAEQSAVTLIAGLAQKIADLAAAGGTPAQFAALSAQLKSATDSLAAAVTANTPAAPPPATPAP